MAAYFEEGSPAMQQLTAIRLASGNLCLHHTAWWARELSHIKQSQLLIKGAGK